MSSTSSLSLEFDNAQVLLRLARIYPSTMLAFLQAVENARDAVISAESEGPKYIWVVIGDDYMEVIENGHGMNPNILPDDQQIIAEHRAKILRGELPRNTNVTPHISDASQSSLEHWVINIGNSAKRFSTKSGDLRGVKGIGSLAWLQYARQATVYTRPEMRLAKPALGETIHERNIPTYVLEFPTLEMIEDHGDLTPRIGTTDTPLKDPWGKELPHGTRIVISRFQEGRAGSLKGVSDIVGALTRKFGLEIRDKRYTMEVVDKTTSPWKRTPIQPSIYLGVPLYDGTLTAYEGVPFHGELYYQHDGKGKFPVVQRIGGEVFDLTSLVEFKDRWPWNSGMIPGHFAWPQYANDDKLWDSGKGNLIAEPRTTNPDQDGTPERTAWVDAILALEPFLLEQIQEIKQRFATKAIEDFGTDVISAALIAMSEMPELSNLQLPKPPRQHKQKAPKVEKSEEETSYSPNKRVIVRVINEYKKGIGGITITLSKGKQVLDVLQAGSYGSVSFGEIPYGDGYRVRVVVPDGMESIGDHYVIFSLNDSHPGLNAVFQLFTGAPAPQQRKVITRLRPMFEEFDDNASLPWRARFIKTVGNIEFNPLAPDLARAIREGDEEAQLDIVAGHTAAALAEAALTDDNLNPIASMNEALVLCSILNAKTKRHLKNLRIERKRAERDAKKPR